MNKIMDILNQNNISGHLIQSYTGDYNISIQHNLKQYIIKQEGEAFKLLESNLALNPKKKNKYHQIDKLFLDITALIGFIKSRNIYRFN